MQGGTAWCNDDRRMQAGQARRHGRAIVGMLSRTSGWPRWPGSPGAVPPPRLRPLQLCRPFPWCSAATGTPGCAASAGASRPQPPTAPAPRPPLPSLSPPRRAAAPRASRTRPLCRAAARPSLSTSSSTRPPTPLACVRLRLLLARLGEGVRVGCPRRARPRLLPCSQLPASRPPPPLPLLPVSWPCQLLAPLRLPPAPPLPGTRTHRRPLLACLLQSSPSTVCSWSTKAPPTPAACCSTAGTAPRCARRCRGWVRAGAERGSPGRRLPAAGAARQCQGNPGQCCPLPTTRQPTVTFPGADFPLLCGRLWAATAWAATSGGRSEDVAEQWDAPECPRWVARLPAWLRAARGAPRSRAQRRQRRPPAQCPSSRRTHTPPPIPPMLGAQPRPAGRR